MVASRSHFGQYFLQGWIDGGACINGSLETSSAAFLLLKRLVPSPIISLDTCYVSLMFLDIFYLATLTDFRHLLVRPRNRVLKVQPLR